MAKLLVIDNYDSFTYNLVQMFMNYHLDIRVFRSDKISLEQIESLRPDYVLISPGPGNPSRAGISIPLIKFFFREIPILGVCLGMQCINEAFGGRTVRAPVPLHGKTSIIEHTGKGIFKSLPPRFQAARYHSLAASNVRDDLEITAHSRDEVIMGLSHTRFPLHGVQFHPESFLTECGFRLVENFLKTADEIH